MTFLEALLLGIIQGLTEFLPVSSSGHLELGSFLLGIQTGDNLLFATIVHGATALSTVFVFRSEIGELIKGLLEFKWNDATKYCTYIVVSMIPVGLVGFLLKDQIEAFFNGNIILVGSMLLLTSGLLAFTYFKKEQKNSVGIYSALIIGLAQTVAIMPGISRSGATISTALLLGIDKEKAARFSFLMVLPPIVGAMLLETKDILEAPELVTDISVWSLLIGFIAAFLAGLVACKWMIALVKKGKLIYFSVYCAVVGLVAITFGLLL